MAQSFELLAQYGALGAFAIAGLFFSYLFIKFFMNQIREHDKEQKQTIANLVDALRTTQSAFEETILKISLEHQKHSSLLKELSNEIKEIKNDIRRKD